MRRRSVSLVIREITLKIQWDTTTPIFKWIVFSSWQYHVLTRMLDNRHTHSLIVWMQNSTANFGNIWRFFRKLNIYNPTILFPDIYWTEIKICISTVTCIQMFIETLFFIVKTWKQPKCPTTNEQTVEYSYNGIRNCNKKEQSTDTLNSMDETWEHYVKWKKLHTT